MSQPTWWRGGRGLPSLIALLLNVLQPPFCTLNTHSWLNWVDEEVGLKEKPEGYYRYIKIRPEALIPNFAIIGNCGLGGNAGAGGEIPARSLILVPPDPSRRCSKFFNLNWSTAFCYQDIINMVPRARHWVPTVFCAPPTLYEVIIIWTLLSPICIKVDQNCKQVKLALSFTLIISPNEVFGDIMVSASPPPRPSRWREHS